MGVIVEALDVLGLALVEHGHEWTERERQPYDLAVAMASGDCTETDSSASAICRFH